MIGSHECKVLFTKCTTETGTNISVIVTPYQHSTYTAVKCVNSDRVRVYVQGRLFHIRIYANVCHVGGQVDFGQNRCFYISILLAIHS